jgi:hypothetical protein
MGNATSYPIDAVARLALTDWAPGQRYSPNTLICVVGAGSDQIGGATGRVRRAT